MKDYPLASFCIVAYKAEKYIADAINAAFAQDYPNLEIIMTDDCSPDRTFEIMQEMAATYKGPHRVILNKNKTNLGPRENYNKALYELSHGEIVLIADGDDISLPQRTKVAVDIMLEHPEISSLSFQSRIVDENLKPISLREKAEELNVGKDTILTLEDYVMHDYLIFSGDSRVLRRSVIDAFPPLKYSFSEDIFLFIRSLYIGSIAYIRQPLVLYRQHSDSIMGKSRARTSFDYEKFNNTTAKQIWYDMDYAISQGYIAEDKRECVTKKMEWVIKGLMPPKKPKNRPLIWRIARAIRNEIIRK